METLWQCACLFCFICGKFVGTLWDVSTVSINVTYLRIKHVSTILTVNYKTFLWRWKPDRNKHHTQCVHLFVCQYIMLLLHICLNLMAFLWKNTTNISDGIDGQYTSWRRFLLNIMSDNEWEKTAEQSIYNVNHFNLLHTCDCFTCFVFEGVLLN